MRGTGRGRTAQGPDPRAGRSVERPYGGQGRFGRRGVQLNAHARRLRGTGLNQYAIEDGLRLPAMEETT